MTVVSTKWFFAAIDSFIYAFVIVIYNLIDALARLEFLNQSNVNDFTTRIYSALGIFMLFKVSFSFINYLVKPDKFMDAQVGFQKFIINVLLVFVMLISFPWVFNLLRDFQNALLDDNIVGNFILGSTNSNTQTGSYQLYWTPYCDTPVTTTSTANFLSLAAFRPFFQYDAGYLNRFRDSNGDITTEGLTEINTNGVLCSSASTGNQTVNSMLNIGNITAPASTGDAIVSVSSSIIDVIAPGTGSAINAFFVDYQVDYHWILSTIFGVILCGILLSFALDISVRSIKLAALQIIAPIPIISYIEPDNSKHNMFKNWATEVGKTWLSLFIRLAALYFAIYVIQLAADIQSTNQENGFYTSLFILLGALIFVKQVPKLLETLIPRLKLDGTFNINPLKKLKTEAIGGRQISNATMGVVGAGVGLAGSAIAHGLAVRSNNNKINAERAEIDKINTNRRNALDRYLEAKNSRNVATSEYNAATSQLGNLIVQQSIAAQQGNVAEYDRLQGEIDAQEAVANAKRQDVANRSCKI